MGIFHLFLCGAMKGVLWRLLGSLGEHFDRTITHVHVHITLDTLCDSKLHHHGNHYQENWVIRKCMEVGEDRSARLQRDGESEGEETGEEFMPKGQKGRVDINTPTQ